MSNATSESIIFRLMGKQFVVHDTVFYSLVIILLLCLFAIFVGQKVKNANPAEKPSGIVNLMEMLVEAVTNLVTSTMGAKNEKFTPYILMLALYLVPANLIGLLGFPPPTSNFNVTFALAIMTFFLIQGSAIKANGVGAYLKGFIEPYPVLLPMNVIGELAVPISLAFRLFGNILSGVIIMSLLYGALGFFAPAVTPVLHAYFDVFSGLLQTFIFAMLTMVFIAMAE